MTRAAATMLVAAAAAGSVALGGGQQEPFRGRSDLVSIFATVTDARNEIVTGLPQDAFEVFDNGKRQAVTVFSGDRLPITAVLMLDRSGSMASDAEVVTDAAGAFVDRLTAGDRAKIGDLSERIEFWPNQFSGDRQQLLTVLRQALQPPGPSPIWTAADRSITQLLHESGRRVVLLFTDGHDAPLREQVHTDVEDVMRRARYDEIMIYAIGVPTASGHPGWSTTGGRSGGFAIHRPEKPDPPDPNLKKLASETGGGYFELAPGVSLSGIFGRIADELHEQYWLGFAPAKLDGEPHRLEVKMKRPGLTVRARKSYVADARH